jgi:hypothetical protein
MSPESKARIGRVVAEVFRAARSTGKPEPARHAEAQRYAETVLGSVVEDEVRKRLAARDGA